MKKAWTNDTADERESVVPRPLETVRRQARRATGSWWTHILLGLVVIALGVFALLSQVNAIATMVALVAVLLLAAGGVEIAIGSTSRPVSWLAVVGGTASLTLGVVALAWPGATLFVVAFFVGISLLAWGAYDIYRSVTDPLIRPRSISLVLGLLLAALGVLVLIHPTVSALVLGILVGVFLIVQGVFSVVLGLRLLDAHRALRRVERRFDRDQHAGHGTGPRKVA